MDVTATLLHVFQIDKQYRGLQTRLRAAERFLAEQTRLLEQLDAKRAQLEGQHRQLTATVANQTGEAARLDARMSQIREQMNAAQTNREYKAFLTEVNTLKVEKDKIDNVSLEQMTKTEELKKQIEELDAQRIERVRVRDVAVSDREQRAAEIKDRLAELKSQREAAAAAVPPSDMKILDELIRTRGDEAMAPLEEQDRKRHEFTCGSCMMSLPVESVATLLRSGKLTRCVSCGCVLFISKELAEGMLNPPSKKGAKSSSL